MKTAMQELIEALDIEMKERGMFPNWNMYLEKEKEQIMKANMDGYKEGCTFHSFGHRPLTTEEYYNQTYNQKQHIIDIMKADEDDGLYKTFDTDPDKKH
jgi:hypothetical protein